MTKLINSQTELWPRSHKVLCVAALLFVILGIFTTPKLLISLGPMRRSLTAHIQSVRDTAYLEVLLFRLLCFVFAASLAVIAIMWRRILDSPFIQSINAHAPKESARHKAIMRPFNKSLLVITGCIGAGLLYVALAPRLFSPELLRMIAGEDGVIEYSTALLFMICSLMSVILSLRFSDQRARVVIHCLFAFGFFLMVGEEISWGQRFFNIDTLGVFKNANVQSENNLHNLFGYFADHIFIVAVLVYGFVLPVLARISIFYRRLFDLVGLPIASPGLAIGFLMISILQSWVVYRFLMPLPHFRLEELRELLSAIAFSLLMFESWLLSRSKEKSR